AEDKTIRIWDLSSSTSITTLQGHMNSVRSVAFSPDGRFIASGSSDNTIRIWDLTSSKSIATLQGHTNFVRSVAFSPDGRFIASGSSDKTIRIWDLKALGLTEGAADTDTVSPTYVNARVLLVGDSGVGKSG